MLPIVIGASRNRDEVVLAFPFETVKEVYQGHSVSLAVSRQTLPPGLKVIVYSREMVRAATGLDYVINVYLFRESVEGSLTQVHSPHLVRQEEWVSSPHST